MNLYDSEEWYEEADAKLEKLVDDNPIKAWAAYILFHVSLFYFIVIYRATLFEYACVGYSLCAFALSIVGPLVNKDKYDWKAWFDCPIQIDFIGILFILVYGYFGHPAMAFLGVIDLITPMEDVRLKKHE